MKKGSQLVVYTYLKKQAIVLDEKGMTQQEIGDVLGVGQSTVNTWLSRYELEGEKYLDPAKLGGGKKSFLKKEEEERLSRLLVEKTAEDYGFEGEYWTRKRVGVVIEKEFEVCYKERSVGDVLKRINFTWQKPKKKVITKMKKK